LKRIDKKIIKRGNSKKQKEKNKKKRINRKNQKEQIRIIKRNE